MEIEFETEIEATAFFRFNEVTGLLSESRLIIDGGNDIWPMLDSKTKDNLEEEARSSYLYERDN